MTGLSGSSKYRRSGSRKTLVEKGIAAFRLDGDNVRHGLSKDLETLMKNAEKTFSGSQKPARSHESSQVGDDCQLNLPDR